MPFHCAKNTLVAKFVSTVKCKFQSLLLEASHRAVVAQISFSRAGIVEDLLKKSTLIITVGAIKRNLGYFGILIYMWSWPAVCTYALWRHKWSSNWEGFLEGA